MTVIRPDKKPVETYTYMWDQKGEVLECYKNPEDKQTVCKLWQVKGPAEFHDAALMDATKKINAVFERLERRNTEKSRHLSFVQFRNRLLLVWAHYGRIGPSDNSKKIRKALNLKAS